MLTLSNLRNETVATNQSEVMEVDTISKNEVSLKNHMSRVPLKISTSFAFIFSMIWATTWSFSCDNKNNHDSPSNTTSVFTTLEMNINAGYPYDEVRATVYDDKRGNQIVAQTTSIRNPVKLTFKDVSDEFLLSFDKIDASLHASSSQTIMFLSNNIAKLDISNPETRTVTATIGIYKLGSITNTLHSGDTDICLIYSNTDCDIIGETTDGIPYIIDIHLKKGWNMIVCLKTHKECRMTTKLLQGETWYNLAG